jgi:hypothetical protein
LLAAQLRVAQWEAWTPAPVKLTVAGEFTALLATETVPVKLLTLVGENAIDNIAVCPAASVEGGAVPVVLNPLPETVIWAMLRLEFPVFVSVTVWVPLPPTATLPKLKLLGVAESWRVRGAMPVPVREMSVGEFAASLTKVILPLAPPACAGANLTAKVAVWPTDNFRGVVIPLMVKPDPAIEAWDRFRLAAPELVSVTDLLPELPTDTLPKLTELRLRDSWGCPLLPEPGPETELALPQPSKPTEAT